MFRLRGLRAPRFAGAFRKGLAGPPISLYEPRFVASRRGLNGRLRFAARQGSRGPASRVPAFERYRLQSLFEGSEGSARDTATTRERLIGTWLFTSIFSWRAR